MEAFEGEMLVNLKARLTEILELIESHDERMINAKNELIYAEGELEKTEADLSNTIRRIDLLTIDFNESSERLKVNEVKLRELEESTEKIETARDQLDEAEGLLDEQIDEIEEKKNDQKREAERAEFSLSSEERRKIIVERDIASLTAKANGFEQRGDILESTLEKAGTSLMECEEREEEVLDREDLNEEKIEFLEGELHETDVRADIAERACQTVERGIIEVENEVNHWKRKVEALAAEMEAMDAVAKIEADIDHEKETGGNGKPKVEGEIKTD